MADSYIRVEVTPTTWGQPPKDVFVWSEGQLTLDMSGFALGVYLTAHKLNRAYIYPWFREMGHII